MTGTGSLTKVRLLSFTVATLLTLIASAAAAEESLRGELRSQINVSIPGEDGYESALNPGNLLGFKDASLINAANLRIEGANDSAAIELRFDFAAYPAATVLTGVADILSLGDPLAVAAVADLVIMAGDTVWSAGLTRAVATWFPSPAFQMSVGRQNFLTGYGYGWNPMDLANPPKNPSDPGAFMGGVDGIAVTIIPAWWLSIITYTILPEGNTDFEDLMTGAELTLATSIAELKLSALYGGNGSTGDDTYPHAAGAGVFSDISGVGVYGEGVVRSRSRRPTVTSSGAIEGVSGPVWSAMTGFEYVFPSGLVLVCEYFFNGEGWDKEHRDNYLNTLTVLPSPSGLYAELYTPAYFSRHYILGSIAAALYVLDANLNLSAVYSVDTGALFITPTFTANLDSAGNLSADVSYSGAISLRDDKADEVNLSPVKHSFSLSLAYAF